MVAAVRRASTGYFVRSREHKSAAIFWLSCPSRTRSKEPEWSQSCHWQLMWRSFSPHLAKHDHLPVDFLLIFAAVCGKRSGTVCTSEATLQDLYHLFCYVCQRLPPYESVDNYFCSEISNEISQGRARAHRT